MAYWRESYFRDLVDATSAAKAQNWLGFADYCIDQERGLRSQAFAALNNFIQSLQKETADERRRFVSWLLAFADEREGHHLLIPHPLRKEIVEPTLREWEKAEPDCPEPHRWLGERDHLERALALDPSDQIARKKLIILLLSGIAHAIHELPQGYLGSIQDDLDALARVEVLLPDLRDEKVRLSYAEAVAEDRAAITRYVKHMAK